MDEWMVAKATSNSYVKQQQGGKFHPGGVPTGNWVHRGGGYIRKKRLSCARLMRLPNFLATAKYCANPA
eukprot:scaffold5169_cov70-Skeletonema_marinoi.AAC.2